MNILEETRIAILKMKTETAQFVLLRDYFYNSKNFKHENISNGKNSNIKDYSGYIFNNEEEEKLIIHEFIATDKSFILHFSNNDLRKLLVNISTHVFNGYELKDINERKNSIPLYTIVEAE